jgi:UPF0755 protein
MSTIKTKYYLAAAFVCLLCCVAIAYYFFFTGFLRGDSDKSLYIDNDDTADSVYVKLDTISTSHGMCAFRTLANHYEYATRLHTGHYVLKPGETAIDVFKKLKNAQQTPVMLTVPPARTMERMAKQLSQRLMLDSATIANALLDSTFCAQHGFSLATIPALFIPDTYEVYWNMGIDRLIDRLQKEHDGYWTKERQQKAETIGLTPVEVATLGSIIDEETANDGEKPMIAGMYLNRLHKGMLLQADPTVKFALKDFALRRILNKHLTVDSPYNTYRYKGLPPGPIRVASTAALDAVLNAAHHDYLYMCAKEDFSGTHNFARTLSEHMANARRYQQALNQRGIK